MSFSSSKVPRVCAWCGRDFMATQRWKDTARTCSRSCRSHWFLSRPEVKAKIKRTRELNRKPVKPKKCEWCKGRFIPASSEDQRFCGHPCSAKWRNRQPFFKKILRRNGLAAGGRNKGEPNLSASIRMSLDNPMWKPGVLERARKNRVSRKLKERGGNGFLTVPQEKLAKSLGFEMEVTIPTAGQRTKLKKIPQKYCVDLAHVPSMTAVEVDGTTHCNPRMRALDLKKGMVLESLGWTVLRFTNKRVLHDLAGVVRDVKSHILEKR